MLSVGLPRDHCSNFTLSCECEFFSSQHFVETSTMCKLTPHVILSGVTRICRPRLVDMADVPAGLDLIGEQAILCVCSTQVRRSHWLPDLSYFGRMSAHRINPEQDELRT